MTAQVPLPRSWRFSPERSLGTEAMDRTELDPRLRKQALVGLERLRRIFLRPTSILDAMVAILPPTFDQTIRIVELGAGSRDLSDNLGRALELTGRHVEMIPTDRVAAPGVHAFDCTGSAGWIDADLYFSNLLLHHLGVDEIRRSLLRQTMHARHGSVHLDLVRNRFGYYVTRFFLPFLRYPLINQSDGLLSIQAAFTVSEMRGLAHGLPGIHTVSRVLPFRQILVSQPEVS